MGDKLKTIYGIIEEPSRHGVQAYAIDGDTGEAIDQHFCSSESFAQSDLGFTEPLFTWNPVAPREVHSTAIFHNQRHQKYAEMYPDGYRLEWVGDWRGDERLLRLRSTIAKEAMIIE